MNYQKLYKLMDEIIEDKWIYVICGIIGFLSALFFSKILCFPWFCYIPLAGCAGFVGAYGIYILRGYFYHKAEMEKKL